MREAERGVLEVENNVNREVGEKGRDKSGARESERRWGGRQRGGNGKKKGDERGEVGEQI